MAKLSAAQKQKQYRMRRDADPVRRAQYLQKRKTTYKADIESGKRKNIENMSEREKRQKRKEWKRHQRDSRKARKNEENLLTPPSSPFPIVMHEESHRSRQMTRGRKKVKASRSKMQREKLALEKQLQQQIRLTNKYKMRLHRMKQRECRAALTLSPRTKTKRLLTNLNTNVVRKSLEFHFSLMKDIKTKYAASKSERERQVISRFFSGNLIKKYKLRHFAKSSTGLSQRRIYHNTYLRKCKSRLDAISRQKNISEFYLRDDVSRVTTGIKNTVTVKQVKKQRRILLDTMLNLHKKFNAESDTDVSYSLFCKLRPFWVGPPKNADRMTCLCKTHENLQFVVDKLYAIKIISSKNVEEIADSIVCDPKSKDCAYNECQVCNLTAYEMTRRPENEEVTYVQWCTKKTELERNGEKSTSVITVKEEVVSSESDLIDLFNNSLDKFKRHLFNIRWQYTIYRDLRQTLTDADCLIHIDFTENYNCKYSTEIQAVHFGGSHQQASLHTGVLYTRGSMIPFCTISESRKHGPAAIWSHLEPILQMIREKYPAVQVLHFFSDGPATQYKQKCNFYLLSTETFNKGFKAATWNFFEASHGKGAPDGIGGSIKRSADRLVSLGKDLPDAQVLFRELKSTNSNIELFYIDESIITKKAEVLSAISVNTIKGTMRFHQVLSPSKGQIMCRDISCICRAKERVFHCPCYDLKHFSITDDGTPSPAAPEVKSVVQVTHPLSESYRPETINNDHIGCWCVISYDDNTYPGKIIECAENDVKVNCMHRTGKNRYHWPNPRPDINWYNEDQVLCLIRPPEENNKRYLIIDEGQWKAMD